MGLISPDYGTIFWMVLSFGVVFFILAKFAWKPIMKGLKDREQSIAGALNAAEEARREMASLKADHEKIMQEARAERDALIGEARKMRDDLISAAREDAAREGANMLQNARKQIENEKLSAIDQIKEQITHLSVEVAERILRHEMKDAQANQQMIHDMLKEMKLN